MFVFATYLALNIKVILQCDSKTIPSISLYLKMLM